MERLQLEIDLREAVERDEITLHYQPEFDVATGELRGFEALARWHRRNHGPVAPPVFIAVAEQSELIAVLGRQLLRKACTEATSWDGLGGHGVLTVAVNVSTIQLRPAIVDDVRSVLEETGLEPSRLMLEVTETAAMSDPETKVPVIEKLKQVGVRFALDDFGTGYSSLTQLTHARFDQLKLDRSFVDSIDRPGTDAVVARSIISLARALDMPVVAEGVETQAQLDCLRELGCNLCQGYLLGKPMPGELVHGFLHERSVRPLFTGCVG
jgi:EAL domain-containing protein (putative c-di-GMP-specific phosphodiesterase class I)